MNPSNPANGTEMILHDTGGDYRLRIGSQTFAQVGIGVQYNTSYFLNVGGLSNFNQARIATDLELLGNLNLTSSTGDIQVPTSGMDIQRSSGDTQHTLRVRDNQGIWEFRNRKLSCLTTGGAGTVMELQNTAAGEVRIGGSSARVVIGTAPNISYFLDVGGTVRAPIFNASTYFWTPSGAYYLNSDMKMYQRADANNSLNIITSNEINFSLQSNKEADPTTATIALQLNDTNGITINRAVTNDLTFNSIGNIVGEADIISWNRFMFQNASEFKEVLDGQYKLFVRNGDTTGSINLTVGLEAPTPEIQLTNAKVNLLGHLDITHDDITGQQRVLINNPYDNGWIRLSNNDLSTLDATTTGVDVYGDLSYTGSLIPSSDKRLKKDIKEINSKKAVELVKYIKPKTYHFIDDRLQGKSCCGFIANDFMETKKMPDEWQNLVQEGKDGHLKFDYTITTPILWSALQNALNRIDKLEKEINKLKGKGKGKSESD